MDWSSKVREREDLREMHIDFWFKTFPMELLLEYRKKL